MSTPVPLVNTGVRVVESPAVMEEAFGVREVATGGTKTVTFCVILAPVVPVTVRVYVLSILGVTV